jgi:Tol biopolymer transport system component
MSAPSSLRPVRYFFLFALLLLLVSVFALPHVKATPIQLINAIIGGGTTTRVSVASDGTEGNATAHNASISEDGRYVTFGSTAYNLVPNDTNGASDIFVKDRQTGTTTRVSTASDGTEGIGHAFFSSISADGRYVVFDSTADNLVADDTNGIQDLFMKDRQTGATTRVSTASDGTQANDYSSAPFISTDGRYIAFLSMASNLVADDTNGVQDVFVKDVQTGATARVSISSAGTQSNNRSEYPSISSDGRYIAFLSLADNLVSDDTNGEYDVFVHDRFTGVTTRVSVATNGTEGNDRSDRPKISANGRYIAFQSSASNLIDIDTNGGTADIFVKDYHTGVTSIVSITADGTQGNTSAHNPSISSDGSYVAFESQASNLVSNDTNGSTKDIFVKDRQLGEITLVSIAYNGDSGNDHSQNDSISGNGRYVAYDSWSSNLVANDNNSVRDVFLRDRGELPPTTPTATPTNVFPSSPTSTLTPTSTYTATNTPIPAATNTPTPTITNTPPPGATLTPTSLPSATPTITNTPPPGATVTPTFTPTQPSENGEVFVPLVLRQLAFATPAPTPTPAPTCEVLDREPNNFFIEANGNLPLCEGSPVTGTVSPNDIDDIYRVEVATSGIVRIDLTNIPNGADYDLYLYNADRGEVTVSNTSGSVDESIRVNLPNGRYYIRVYSRLYTGANTYQLRWARE